MTLKKEKILSLLAIQRNLYNQKRLYKSKRTGLAFCVNSDTYDLNINIKGSDDWKDWLGNASQIIMLIIGIFLVYIDIHVIGYLLICLALSFNFSYFFGGIESFFVLKKMSHINSHNKIFIFGHSRGGPIGFYLLILIKLFYRKTQSCLITTGSPIPVRNINPISWCIKSIINFINKKDVVPKSQPWFLGYFRHPGKRQFFTEFGSDVKEQHDLQMYEYMARKESEDMYIF